MSAGAPALPDRLESVEHLEEVMTQPGPALVADLAAVEGDILIVGIGGKMGPTLARLAKRAAPDKRIVGVARFSEPGLEERLNGWGVERSNIRGAIMLTAAAGKGSEHACGILGYANAEGRFGLDKDPQEATRWYREMQKCESHGRHEHFRERAAAWLREHP